MKAEKKLCHMTVDQAMRNGNRSKGQDYYQIHLDGQKFSCPSRSRLFALALARGYTHVSLYYMKTGLARTVKL
jgi:hypothetical protein